jgi:hypothetical protein
VGRGLQLLSPLGSARYLAPALGAPPDGRLPRRTEGYRHESPGFETGFAQVSQEPQRTVSGLCLMTTSSTAHSVSVLRSVPSRATRRGRTSRRAGDSLAMTVTGRQPHYLSTHGLVRQTGPQRFAGVGHLQSHRSQTSRVAPRRCQGHGWVSGLCKHLSMIDTWVV